MIKPDLQALADEYIVGLMGEAETEDLENQMAVDPDLTDAVAEARERFLEVDLTETPLAVDPDSWRHVARRLDASPSTAEADNATVLPFTKLTQTTASTKGPWKATALAALAASLVLAMGLGWQFSRPAPLVIAVLMDGEGEPRALVEAFADDGARVTPLGNIDIPKGQTLEVWTLPDVPDAKPVSLGRLDQVRTLKLNGPDLPLPQIGQLYEITIEQKGGSPTGLPTGPIVGKGFAKFRL